MALIGTSPSLAGGSPVLLARMAISAIGFPAWKG